MDQIDMADRIKKLEVSDEKKNYMMETLNPVLQEFVAKCMMKMTDPIHLMEAFVHEKLFTREGTKESLSHEVEKLKAQVERQRHEITRLKALAGEEEEEEEEPEPVAPEPAPAPVPPPSPAPAPTEESTEEDEDLKADEDLLNQKPDPHLGGLQSVVKSIIEEEVKPISDKVDSLESALGKAEKGVDLEKEIAPLAAKVDEVVAKAGAEGVDFTTAVQGVKTGIENLKGLKSELDGKASAEEVNTMATKVTEAISKPSASAGALKDAYKTAAKNKKYLKRIYKDLHR